MDTIHQQVRNRINNVLRPSLKELDIKKSFRPAVLDCEDDPDERTEILIGLADEGLQARLFLDDKEWVLWVYKSNKDGSVSKRFPEQLITLAVPRESFSDHSFVLREFMRTVLNLENQSDSVGKLMAKPIFQNHYKPAMKTALQNPNLVRTREERDTQLGKKDTKIWLWISAIFILVVLLTSNNGSNYPEGCTYVPDPRGGYVDC